MSENVAAVAAPSAAPAAPAIEAQPAAPVTAPVVETPAAPEPAAQPNPEPSLYEPPKPEVTVLNGTEGEGGVIEYDATGDPALDVALSFLGSLGFAGDSDAMQAAANGDFRILEAKLAAMGDKAAGWERMIALAKDAHTKSETSRAEAVKATNAVIVAVAGSAENWQTITSWAAKNADPAEKASINAMIDSGDVVQARAAALLLQSAYNSAKGTSVQPKPAVRDAAGGQPVGQGPLNDKDYAAAVRELKTKLGYRMEGSSEYADLQRRRAR